MIRGQAEGLHGVKGTRDAGTAMVGVPPYSMALPHPRVYHPLMNITLISPFHGGSHRAWAEGYAKASAHTVTLLTLPDRHWKWRMHGGAITLARRFLEEGHAPDLILATDMLDLTTFLALTRDRTARVPIALYMHENQLTYPWPDEAGGRPSAEQDRHYAFINVASMLAADAVVFNSNYHRDSFFAALPEFLKPFPDHNEPGSIEVIRKKSHVLPVGVDLRRLGRGGGDCGSGTGSGEKKKSESEYEHEYVNEKGDGSAYEYDYEIQAGEGAPLILWNQRWEYDKNPEAFFDALYHVADAGIPFRLALCGERYTRWPAIFNDAQERLHDLIVHSGYATSERYRELLWDAAITISTAHHEFFGISVVEAMYCHTFPLLPNRLSYPELIPCEFHNDCLYTSHDDLIERLVRVLRAPGETAAVARRLAASVANYDWSYVSPKYDELFAQCSR